MTSMIRSTIAAFGLMLMVAALSGSAMAFEPPNDVPELDSGSIGSAVTLATGALVVLRGRRAARTSL